MSLHLASAMRPISYILSDPETEDLAIQKPGEGWWLRRGAWERVDLPAMTFQRLHGLSVMAAAQTRQHISPNSPILSADLPGLLRLQAVMPPAVPPGTMALSFRRGDEAIDDLEQITNLWDTSRWNKWADRSARVAAEDAAILERYDAGDLVGFLRALVTARKTGLFCGPTGAGKTRLSKMLGGVIPLHKRIITVENAIELVVRQLNCVRHIYSGSGQNGATPTALLKATLRERPDIVLLAEMRDAEEASVFLDEVMAGHPGSMSTIHGSTPPEAARRLFGLIKSAPGKTGMLDETVADAIGSAIDFIIPAENSEGRKRAMGEIWFKPEAARRGETFRDLLRVAS